MHSPEQYQVTLDGDAPNMVAQLVSTLVRENVEMHPGRVRIARRISSPIAVYLAESEAAATLVFGERSVTVSNGIAESPKLLIKATMKQVGEISKIKVRFKGLVPVGFLSQRGAKIIRTILGKELTIDGLVRHPITAVRFISLISVAK